MDRSSTSSLISWLLIPVAALLIQSALGMPGRAYTGLALRGDLVASVDPGSPGEMAGLVAGDRLAPAGDGGTGRAWREPLRDARPGRPVLLRLQRAGESGPAWIVPSALPAVERRLLSVLLAIASVFVMLGGWVWSERRDALTRTFFLLCLSFACLLAPPPRWTAEGPAIAAQLALAGVTLVLPALFIHFFALFPESRAGRRRRHWVTAGYAISAALFAAVLAVEALGRVFPGAPVARDALSVAAAVWFASGLLAALGLFWTSYRGAGSPDSRRRLRVALVGCILGLGPLATLTAARNISPGTFYPGERWAVVMTLLVPASIAWAVVVHRVFDFRVALRAGLVTALVAAAGATAWAAGEWWSAVAMPQRAAEVSGGALALVILAACLAGPAAPLLRALGARLVPGDEGLALISSFRDAVAARVADAPGADSPPADGEALLARACSAISGALRLSGCMALAEGPGGLLALSGAAGRLTELGPGLRRRAFQLAARGVQSVDEAALDPADREGFELAGVRWLLSVGEAPSRTVLLLGRRLAGPWLSRHEVAELERLAAHLGMALENAVLRREASTHGALERELRAAGAVQAHLLPQRVPVHPTLDCAAVVLSCEPVGGDYYDFVEGANREFTLAVGDAAGKGMPAALLLAHVQARFRGRAGDAVPPGTLLAALNQELFELDQPEKFMGLLCARVDVRQARVRIANGGLTPPLVRRRDGSVDIVEGGGPLLGVSAGASYPESCLALGPGEVLLVHTDGLTEASRGEEMFGVERVREVLGREGHRRASDIVAAMLSEVRAFADGPLDDLTVVVLRQLTATRPRPETS